MNTTAVPSDRATWERLAAQAASAGARRASTGSARAAQDGRVFDDVSPIDGAVICQVARCGAADVASAVAAARRSFEAGVWRRTEPRERKRILRRFADAIRADTVRLALLETRDVGKPIRNSVEVDVANCADCIEYYAEFADKLNDEVAPTGPLDLALIRREPLGVVGAIVPWNYPLIISCWKVGPALLTGNSVVLKPAEQSPLSGIRLGELALEAGVPPGVFNVVPGLGEEAGKALALHPDVDLITFTGSTEVGRLMLRYASESNLKRVALECGGKTPQVGVRRCGSGGRRLRHRLGHLLQQRGDLSRRLAPHRARERQGGTPGGDRPRHRHHHPRAPARGEHADGGADRCRSTCSACSATSRVPSPPVRASHSGATRRSRTAAASMSKRPCSMACARR